MKSLYGQSVPQFVDWPIGYNELSRYYSLAEQEMGVSGNKTEQEYLQIKIDGDYPMPQIPMSEVDHKIDEALALFTAEERRSLGTNDPIIVRGSPAARNSQPYRGRRPALATPIAFRSARFKPNTIRPSR